ncbi:MAG: beta strand repeat-containing protein [Poseidonibacter sp.]|uniref:beta strand repeat-containing protein n=1 Tax=Poseidonibacter sp. TaxID=2321188 RepID=UPI00359E3FBD
MSIDSTLLKGDVNITNNAIMNITNLDASPSLNLSTLNGTGTTTVISDGNVVFTGNIASADLSITNNSTFTANAGAVELGTGIITVDAGSILNVDSTEILGQTVNGSGTTNIINMQTNSGTSDYSTITTNVSTLNWSGTGTDFSGNIGNADLTISSGTMNIVSGATLENGSLRVSSSAILNIDVNEAHNQVITNNATVNVTSFQDKLDVDVSAITGTGTTNLNWTATDATFIGDIANANLLVSGGNMTIGSSADISGTGTLSVSGAGTMTLDASKATNEVITGTGTVAVTNLDATPTANLSSITTTNVTALSDANVTFTGNLGKAVTTITSNSIFTLDNSAILGTSTFTVNSGSTLSADTSKIVGTTVSGTGIVSLTNLDDSLNADFATINSSTTLNVDFSGTGTYAGNLTNVDKLTVSSGAMTVDASIVNTASTITNAVGATLNVNNLEAVTAMDFTKVTNNGTLNANWSGDATYIGNLTNVDDLTISSGTMTVNDSILGLTTVTGNGNLIVQANDATLDLSNVSSTLGTVTINDLSASSITGSAGDDTLNLASGNDTVNLGAGNDSININIENLDINDNITDTSGNDSLTFNNSGTIDSADVINLNAIETLNMHSGDDTVTFDTVSEFNNFINEFNDINDIGGNDSLSFGSTAISGDLDFSKLSDFENLNLSSTNDTITLSGDEATNVNGLDGDDDFTLDFTNIDSFNIDGGSNVTTGDTVNLNGNTGTTLTSDTNFGHSTSFDNIEVLDISSLTLNTQDDTTEFEFTDALIESWTSGSNNLTLKLTSTQAEKIKFTDVGGDNVIGGGDDTIYDGDSNTVSDNTTYDLGNTTLTIDLIDV